MQTKSIASHSNRNKKAAGKANTTIHSRSFFNRKNPPGKDEKETVENTRKKLTWLIQKVHFISLQPIRRHDTTIQYS